MKYHRRFAKTGSGQTQKESHKQNDSWVCFLLPLKRNGYHISETPVFILGMPASRLSCKRKRVSLFQASLCLSRACLGKMIVLSFQKAQKYAFSYLPAKKAMRVLSSGVFEELSVVDIVPSLSWQKRYNYNEEVLFIGRETAGWGETVVCSHHSFRSPAYSVLSSGPLSPVIPRSEAVVPCENRGPFSTPFKLSETRIFQDRLGTSMQTFE